MTWTLFIPFLWLMIVLSRNTSRWVALFNPRSSVEQSVTIMQTGSTIDQIVFSFFFVICLLILMKRSEKVINLFKNNRIWLLLYLYCAISILWSDFAFISLKRFIKDLNALLVVLVVYTEPDPIEAFKAIVRRNMYLLVPLSIAFCKYFPYLGRYQHHSGTFTYCGVATSKNSLGMLCLVGGLIFFSDIWNIWKKRASPSSSSMIYLYWFYLILIMFLFAFANSMTSLVSFLFASAILVSDVLKRHLRKIILLSVVIYFSGLGDMIYDSVNLLLKVLERDLSLTGRVPLWEAVLSMEFNALLGTGYGVFWLGDRLTDLWNMFAFRPKQAHNGYLEVYINLGMIGLVILVTALLSSFRKLTDKDSSKDSFWAFQVSFFSMYILYNITEATFLFNATPLWFTFLFIVFHQQHTAHMSSDQNI